MTTHAVRLSHRRFGDFLLFGVTLVELAILFFLTPTFTIVDWIYISQHLLVLGIALTRPSPFIQDRSILSGIAVAVAYTYSYAQIIYLRWAPGDEVWPEASRLLVMIAAGLSLFSLLTLGRLFGVRPALRGLATKGPYALVRHPMYLSYIVSDIGYNLQEWNWGTALMVIVGWASLIYRIQAEEKMLSHDDRWSRYAASVHYRLLPGIW